jgi:hypothetical protein
MTERASSDPAETDRYWREVIAPRFAAAKAQRERRGGRDVRSGRARGRSKYVGRHLRRLPLQRIAQKLSRAGTRPETSAIISRRAGYHAAAPDWR